jgi:hypothetical protein
MSEFSKTAGICAIILHSHPAQAKTASPGNDRTGCDNATRELSNQMEPFDRMVR